MQLGQSTYILLLIEINPEHVNVNLRKTWWRWLRSVCVAREEEMDGSEGFSAFVVVVGIAFESPELFLFSMLSG